jgi:beta-glucosidase
MMKSFKFNKQNWFFLALPLLVAGCGQLNNTSSTIDGSHSVDENKADKIWPKIESDVKKKASVEQRVTTLLATMTLQQKVAQMIQPEIRDITIEDMRKYVF